MSPEEQTFHEYYIDTFNTKFGRWLDNCPVNSNGIVIFNLFYFPAVRKFYINQISINEDLLLYHMKNDKQFFESYLLTSFPENQ